MNSDEAWKEGLIGDYDLQILLKPGLANLRSEDPMEKLKRNFLAGGVISLVLSLTYVIISVSFPFWQVIACVIFVFLFTIWNSFISFRFYYIIRNNHDERSVLANLEYYDDNIRKWLKVQQHAALIIYPFSGTGGFLIGGSLGAGVSVTQLLQKPVVGFLLLGSLAVLVPCCYYLAKWMNKKSYGKYLAQLQASIASLKSPNQ